METENKNHDYGINSLIDTVAKDLTEALSSRWGFSRGCKDFSEKCIEAMRNYALAGKICDNKCEYCEHFKFVIDRAKHYAETLQLSIDDVLTAWEKKREYWWLNYYQDCNQPLIEITGTLKVFDTYQQAVDAFGKQGFRCPCCGGVSTKPFECDSGLPMPEGKICNWKSYGFLRCLGKGVTVIVKEDCSITELFMPIAWERESQ